MQHQQYGQRPGFAAPEAAGNPLKSEGCGVSAAFRGDGEQESGQRNSASDDIAEQAPQPYAKRVANCTARLALLGFSMHPLVGDSFVISRWNMSRTVADIADAERFLKMVGGADA